MTILNWEASHIAEVDQRHVWHPYAPRSAAQPSVPVRATSGTTLHLADGRDVIDGMSSWWAACHGHGHPQITAAAHRQIDTMSHVMFGGLTHQPAAELAERLVAFAGREAEVGAAVSAAGGRRTNRWTRSSTPIPAPWPSRSP